LDPPGRSLAGMFEEFVEDREHGGLGIILFGEASPLTFALEEHIGEKACFYDARPTLSENKRLVDRPREVHPPHCSPEDIAYLEAKGAFTLPDPQTFEAYLEAFLTRFYPLYTIVNKSELLEAHERNTLPWIMLQGICLIGATFCDASVIHRTGHRTRAQARKTYYGRKAISDGHANAKHTDRTTTEKAKVLWSANYETDKFVLLETVLMLSFMGPQMNSVYNACSWLDFAFTIAESMGIHRSTSSLGVNSKDKGRVKRLWWTLAVRDAYCAALLGRPFRINIPQCDVSTLEIDDFASELTDLNRDSALYQIAVAQLSIIARNIIQRRFHSSEACLNLNDLQEDLRVWRAQLPPELSPQSLSSSKSIFPKSLDLLYHQHIILLHFDRAHGPTSPSIARTASPAEIATSAAQAIASSASELVTNQLVHRLPHEVFMGFFISGIVYYRQIHAANPLLSQVARASLDNCRMLLYEARDAWDPAHWSIRIFDFLLSRAQEQGRSGQASQGVGNAGLRTQSGTDSTVDQGNSGSAYSDITLDPFDLASMPDLSIPGTFDDFLSMPNFFIPSA
jgi:hypothetical protein